MNDLLYVGVFIACLLATLGLAKLCNALGRSGGTQDTDSTNGGVS